MKICNIDIPDDFKVIDKSIYSNADDGILFEYLCSIQDNANFNSTINILKNYFKENPKEIEDFFVTYEAFCEGKDFSLLNFLKGLTRITSFCKVFYRRLRFFFDSEYNILPNDFSLDDCINVEDYFLHLKIYDYYVQDPYDKYGIYEFLHNPEFSELFERMGINVGLYDDTLPGKLFQDYINVLCGNNDILSYESFVAILNEIYYHESVYYNI